LAAVLISWADSVSMRTSPHLIEMMGRLLIMRMEWEYYLRFSPTIRLVTKYLMYFIRQLDAYNLD